MNRRNFIQSATAATCTTLVSSPLHASSAARLTLPAAPGPLMAPDFVGLSYETGQLYNANFFSPSNHPLVEAFRTLSSSGILRLGGHLSNITDWEGAGRDEPHQLRGIRHGIEDYWEWPLVDPTIQRNKRGLLTRQALRNLRAFLDATNWRLLYSLNFASGSPARAADEAQAVASILGPRLVAFIVGNEVDGFNEDPVFRPATYGPPEFLDEYQLWVSTIRQKLPAARFAGPDTDGKLDSWVLPFAHRTRGDLLLLTSHYYGMGPASNPAMTAQRLLSKATSAALDTEISAVARAREAAGGIPYRMDEGNSCFGGGRPGVSDAYASALWAADYILRAASAGFAGVNFHGGGTGIYTPIESSDASPAAPRPVYYGLQFAQTFAGARVARCTLSTNANIAAYRGTKNDKTLLAFVNKGDSPVVVDLPPQFATRRLRRSNLRGPALDAKTGVVFGPALPIAAARSLEVSALSGAIFEEI